MASGVLGDLRGEQLRQGGGRDRARGVVPVAQDACARSSAARMSRLPIARSGSATAASSSRTSRAAIASTLGAIEQVGPIVEPQLQPLARQRRQAQRIMRGVVAASIVGEPQTAGLGRQRAAVDRIVLEHHQRVEQLAQAGQALDLGQPQMLVRHQPRLAVLQLLQQRAAAACWPAAAPAAAAC